MPYQVQQLLKDKPMPVCVRKEDAVVTALALMIKHDFSQLPVVFKQHDIDVPAGMITYEGILRGVKNFKAKLEDLKVRDVMSSAPQFTLEDDLFDILEILKATNAVLVIGDYEPELVGIVTSYDTTEYFRNRAEDLMRVEDIELSIKELIKEAYLDDTFEVDDHRLLEAAGKVVHRGQGEKPTKFDELTLGEYMNLLTLQETWAFFEQVFHLSREAVKELLSGVREIRNSLAHFRPDISAEQQDKLKFSLEWLSRCHEEYQVVKQQERIGRAMLVPLKDAVDEPSGQSKSVLEESSVASISSSDFTVTESATTGGRYARLADWLQSQPGGIDLVQLTLNQVEEIIGSELPPSAREHRAWWANDTVSHSQSQLWLDAGWRTTYIHLSAGRITFNRIREREKAYIAFFSKLLSELRKKAGFPIRDISPDGVSWVVLQTVPRTGPSLGSFSFSFSRDKRLRVELYLDLLDQERTKRAFDKLFGQKDKFEQELGSIEWERLDDRRASRLALYKEGQVTDQKNHVELRRWAVDSMINFFNVLIEPTEKAIAETKKE